LRWRRRVSPPSQCSAQSVRTTRNAERPSVARMEPRDRERDPDPGPDGDAPEHEWHEPQMESIPTPNQDVDTQEDPEPEKVTIYEDAADSNR